MTTKEFAIYHHQKTNHLYDGYLPYEYHLRMVVFNAEKYKHILSNIDTKSDDIKAGSLYHFELIQQACWCHDLIEDCRINFYDVKVQATQYVADIVYACTNSKGRNRKEREDDAYFEGIKNTAGATFVKLCDRMANIQHSLNTDLRYTKAIMYAKEHDRFKEKLYSREYDEMFKWLDSNLQNKI